MKIELWLLKLTVFLSGAACMIVEISGSRLLAPVLGTSILVWTSLIGVVLTALSLGYAYGGKFADRQPSFTMLMWLVFAAGLSIGLVYVGKDMVLRFVQHFSLIWAAIWAVILLFALPAFLLAMISPFAVRLAMHSVQESGRISGNFSAMNALGSIVGTFLAGFVLLAYMHTSSVFLATSLVLMVFAITCLMLDKQNRKLFPVVCLVVGALFLLSYLKKAPSDRPGIHKESFYNEYFIYDTSFRGKPARMVQAGLLLQAAKYKDDTDLVFDYTQKYRLDDLFVPGHNKGLMLGGAIQTVPHDIIARHPGNTVDVVEIDPLMTQMASELFGFVQNDQISVYHEDARTFLNRNKKQYDVVYVDTFLHSYAIPFQMTTTQAIQGMYDALQPKGAVMVNLIASLQGEKSELMHCQYQTFASVFPEVYVGQVNRNVRDLIMQNLMLVAFKQTVTPQIAEKLVAEGFQKLATEKVCIFQDDFAPVEYLGLKMI